MVLKAKGIVRAGCLALVSSLAVAATLAGTATPSFATYRVLHSFCRKSGCPDGGPSLGGMISDGAGNLFGAALGGPGNGVIFQLASAGKTLSYSLIHKFCTGSCRDGAAPEFSLIRDAAGNLYGTTTAGGGGNGGIVFELVPGDSGWRVKILHSFCTPGPNCTEGAMPSAGLTYKGAAAGLPYDGQSPLYGTTAEGGALNGGTVFSLSPTNGKWHARALYDFCADLPCPDGSVPLGGLAVDDSGNLFGVANLGGASDEGVVFELSPRGNRYDQAVIYSFCAQQSCTDGVRPDTALALDPAGHLYGTTTRAGDHDEGTLFELSPDGGTFDFSILYQFCGETACSDGGDPEAPLTLDESGNLYGTTNQGGNSTGTGTVFEFSPANGGGTEKVLYDFCSRAQCADGGNPKSPVVFDETGALVGTTVAGGTSGTGVAFRLGF